MGFEPKKLALLRILQILHTYSDEQHRLTQEEIGAYLDKEYGIVLERKAIARNLELLKDAGFELDTQPRQGVCLTERTFTNSELRLLIDGVLCSRYIPVNQTKDLIEKLCRLTNTYFSAEIKHVYAADQWNKTENHGVFYSVGELSHAISKRKAVRFEYHKYGVDKKMHITQCHTVSPYQMLLKNQRYYLLSYDHDSEAMRFFRLDRIKNIAIAGDVRYIPGTEASGSNRSINYKRLSNSLPYMYTDKPQTVIFTAPANLVDQIIDWFGRDIRVLPKENDTVEISLEVSLEAMELWALQYAKYVTVTFPPSLVQTVKADLEEAIKRY